MIGNLLIPHPYQIRSPRTRPDIVDRALMFVTALGETPEETEVRELFGYPLVRRDRGCRKTMASVRSGSNKGRTPSQTESLERRSPPGPRGSRTRYCSASALTRRSARLLVIVSLSAIGPSPIYDASRGEASESGEVREISHMVVRADMRHVARQVITQPRGSDQKQRVDHHIRLPGRSTHPVLLWEGRAWVYCTSHARVVEWQTRGTQNPVPATACEFDPRLGHPQPSQHVRRTKDRGLFPARWRSVALSVTVGDNSTPSARPRPPSAPGTRPDRAGAGRPANGRRSPRSARGNRGRVPSSRSTG